MIKLYFSYFLGWKRGGYPLLFYTFAALLKQGITAYESY